MKSRLFTSFAAAGLLLAGCAMEEAPMEGGSIAAIMEDIQTRTAVTDEGTFTWSAGDQVWLEITANPGYVTGTLSSGAGTGSANFSYGTYFGDMTGKAVYPFNAGHDINGDELSVVLPASYDLGTNLSNTNAAMYGVETDGNIKFNHLAGVMRFKFRNAPVGTDKFILTLDKKINGTFTADLTEDHPALQTESTSNASEKSITLNFDALTSVQDIMLYVPLPLGTYTTLGLEVKAGSQSVWSYSNTVTNTINRKSLILMPTVTLAGSVSGDIEGGEAPSVPSDPVAVNLSDAGSANSYIVSENGTYKFTPTKGNSVESVGAISSVEVLWESFGTSETPNVGDLIKSVKYEEGTIVFETPSTFKEGNAVIAAKDASGTILWSWHIWLTDQPEGQEYYNNAGTLMDRNLGATSATPGDVGALGLLYQWGRKDPFLGSYSISGNTVAKSTITWPSAVLSDATNGTISYATAFPTTFIIYNEKNFDWYYTGSKSTDDARWTPPSNDKSIYDPCPAGWRVLDADSDGVWITVLGSSSTFTDASLYDSANEGMNFSEEFGSDSYIWYPASGYRSSTSGSLASVGYTGSYWSASAYSYNAHVLFLNYYGEVKPSYKDNRAYGYSVRCAREQSRTYVPQDGDYVDEYGINHGQGIEIDGVVWAPVNCGYHATDYKYGKLYQWGRKYGQGYDGNLYDVEGNTFGTHTDASVPSKVSGPVSLLTGQLESNSNKFYYNSSSPYDWVTPQDNMLWNSGTEDNPVKTEYDPCPEGWRVPTYAELSNLVSHRSSWTTNDGKNGFWFSGSTTYSESGLRIFFPAAGDRYNGNGNARDRGYYGDYWSSSPSSNRAYRLSFYRGSVTMGNDSRAYGYPVRCVQE